MKPGSYLGRGLEAGHDKPFGWYWHAERAEIRAHLIRRGVKCGTDDLADARLESRISAIQGRIHRNAPIMRDRQAAWLASQQPTDPEPFTPEELARIAEHFAGANDPISASIYEKASR